MKIREQYIRSFVIMLVSIHISYEIQIKTNTLQDYEKIWKVTFQGPKDKSCQARSLAKKTTLDAAKREAESVIFAGRPKKGKFAWLKRWGYGYCAYLFDYLDPAIRPGILEEFHLIYDDMMKESRADTSEYKDPFDFKKIIAASHDKSMNEKMLKDLSLLNKNYVPEIYNVSVNAVQLRSAILKWKWEINFPHSDFAGQFIRMYDINGDGRLNPRELLLGAIDNNKNLIGTNACSHCFNEIRKTLEAMFTYIDCTNTGFIDAQKIWKNLKNYKRPSYKYDIFSLGSNEGIRTSAINDFVLKNMQSRKGILNKKEFITGILLGFWDRQTEFKKIINNDSRTLKELRWENETVDIAVREYLKEIQIQEAEQK